MNSRCHIKELTNRFLKMNDQEIEYVYMICKDQPYVKEAYIIAKLTRKSQSVSKNNLVDR